MLDPSGLGAYVLRVRLDRRLALTCVFLYAAAQISFLINIDTPRGLDFDESHYVPAARQLLDGHPDPNREHPPLGKILIAGGIALFGDRPLGWRFMSTVFGALTLVGMYVWGVALFKDRSLALWAALVTLVNHLLYVQGRIGMLDTFMFAFLAWAAAAVIAALDPRLEPQRARLYLAIAGWMLGFAMATKWFGVVAWVACLGLLASVRFIHRYWPKLIAQDAARDFTNVDLARGLVLYPLLAYAICFIPRIVSEHQGPWYTAPAEFLQMQARMYSGQLAVPGQHPYMSHWYQWPFLTRPIRYAFDHDGARVRGVLLLGNPLVMWAGMVALVFCAIDVIRRRSREALLILFFYLAFFASWVVIPRKLSLYYYYYPAAMNLIFALAYVLRDRSSGQRYRWARWMFLVSAAAVFVYFLPVLSGSPIANDAFTKWMWFRSWI
jgi:dolichyl-phosphate-mannose--protein O-mannosyl transferase